LELLACKPTLDAPSPSAGSVDFSTYVAVGNSLTAGFSNGTGTGAGLYREGQDNSYTSILAKAMQATGKGPAEFLQPLYPVGSAGLGYAYLKGLTNGIPRIGAYPQDPTQVVGLQETSLLGPQPVQLNITNGMDIHNLGVPGIKLSDIDNVGYGVANPIGFNTYYERILPNDKGFMSYLSYTAKRKPTFFTAWLGSNDVLLFALNGNKVVSPGDGITPQSVFETKYALMLDTLMRTTSKGLVATIPQVTSAPYFTTVPQAPIVLDATQAGQLQAGYNAGYNLYIKGLNAGLPEGAPRYDTARFVAGANVPMIFDPNPLLAAVGNQRPLRPQNGELILLTASDSLGVGQGTKRPLDNKYVLDSIELKALSQATTAYNTFIRNQASSRKLALFDAEEVLKQVKAGTYNFDGLGITADFITGGVFSLDGVHPTARGYALIANEMIKAINTQYVTSLSPVNGGDYVGVTLPK
jgi:hypothetical protein